MDSILVVYYSNTGTARRVAQLLASHRGWPVGEVTDPKPRGTWRCVLDSLLRRRPEIRYTGPDPGDFRTVVLVAPIWMYRLAGPMRSFVSQHRVALQRVAVICTMNSGGATNAFQEITHRLGHRPIAVAALRERDFEDGTATGALLDFGTGLQPPSAPLQPAHAGLAG